MHKPLIRDGLTGFQNAHAFLGSVDADAAAHLLAAANDVALVIDANGVICDLAFAQDLTDEGYAAWRGRPWIDTVTVESREKVERLLDEASTGSGSPWRELNHPSKRGIDVPIRYCTIKLTEAGPIVAIGRDLRGVSDLQRKLVDAQATMERDYARLRQAEMRYRLLFQVAAEAVIIADATTRRLTEANPVALELLGLTDTGTAQIGVADLFDPAQSGQVGELLAVARSTGRAESAPMRLAHDGREVGLSVSFFRQDRAAHFLIRLLPASGEIPSVVVPAKMRLLDVVENLPDAIVICDTDLRILTANTAFLDLAQVSTLDQARGEPLSRWLGRSAVDTNVLVASLREHGSARHFGTVVCGSLWGTEEVEVAAVSVPKGDPPCYGFSIRPVGHRLPASLGEGSRLPESVAHLTELVGRVPMKELVRETSDLIERMCIEAALKLTNDNRASAAEMLGLSRQSFYAKMRRFGLGDLGGDDEDGMSSSNDA